MVHQFLRGVLFILLWWNAYILHAQRFNTQIQTFLNEHQTKQGWTKEDIQDWVVTDEHTNQRNKITHVYIRQRHRGIEIYNAVANFTIDSAGVIRNMGDRLQKRIATRINTTTAALTPQTAVEQAAQQLGLTFTEPLRIVEAISTQQFIFSNGGISRERIPAKLMYQPLANGQLILSWDVALYDKKTGDWWNVRVDARTGKIIDKTNWTAHCQHGATAAQCTQQHMHGFSPNTTATTTAISQYRVFPYPAESPNHTAHTLVTNPADAVASPFGWHNVINASGIEYTYSRGNNVYVYDDATNLNMPTISVDATTGLTFDYLYTPNADPLENWGASLTQLFYANNYIHDVWYHYGFDEQSGNFQVNNFNKGGTGVDEVQAEAFDGSGRDNANFSTPPDGYAPRMQMYRWSRPVQFRINAPLSIAGVYDAKPTACSGVLSETVPLVGELVMVEDAIAPINDGCNQIINASALNGKIAVVDRGTCFANEKAYAAQLAGAIALIIINDRTGRLSMLGNIDGNVTIPTLLISQADGLRLRTALRNGVRVEGGLLGSPDFDSDFDNGIIAHEYGHGISNRLTGGASNTNCLSNAEQMGEGWSDWCALMLTMKAGDLPTTPRGLGTYTINEPMTGLGIRPAYYTTDMSINNYTYGRTNDPLLTQPHGVGFVWATMLWDLTWELVALHGFDSDIYNGTGGNNIAMQLVLEAMKIQPCNPGFVDGRDAILMADSLSYGGAHSCLIWRVFARRGLGVNAQQGNSDSRADQVENFEVPTACQTATVAPIANFESNVEASCDGDIQFTDKSQHYPTAYQWTFGDGTTSTSATPTHHYTQNGSYTVELIVSNAAGADTTRQVVEVHPPTRPVLVDSTARVCMGTFAVARTTAAAGTPVWYDVNNVAVAAGDTFRTPPIFAPTTFFVKNTLVQSPDTLGKRQLDSSRSIPASGFSATAMLNIRAHEPCKILTAEVYSTMDNWCSIMLWENFDGRGMPLQDIMVYTPMGRSRIVLNVNIPGAGDYSLGGTNLSLLADTGLVAYPYSTPELEIMGSYPLTNAYYCFYNLSVQPEPCRSAAASFVVTPDGARFTYTSQRTTVNFLPVPSTTGALTWDFGDGTTSTLTNPSHTYATADNYTVTLTSLATDGSTCVYRDVVRAGIELNVSESESTDKGIHLQPNPTTSQSLLVWDEPTTTEQQIAVYAADGRLVHTAILASGSQYYTIPSHTWSAGIYWVMAVDAQHRTTQKLVIQK